MATTRALKVQFFFCFGSFFFLKQVRQVKVVFLRTLRNAATRLPSPPFCTPLYSTHTHMIGWLIAWFIFTRVENIYKGASTSIASFSVLWVGV